MHMILRTLWIFLKRPWLQKSQISEVTRIKMRVLPTDLDVLMHVNNGVYFSYMDFGRWDMSFRNGVYDLYQKKNWYAVVASETIKFRRSLKLWDHFSLETQIIGFDEKYFYIKQRFVHQGELMAVGLVKLRFLARKGGTLSTAEVMRELPQGSFINQAQELAPHWQNWESSFLS
jgi:YbgC/YbaW family acyl-CoA thioester hydrolase